MTTFVSTCTFFFFVVVTPKHFIKYENKKINHLQNTRAKAIMNNSHIKIVHENEESWETEYPGLIKNIEVDGEKILQIHMLALKCEKIATQVRIMTGLLIILAIGLLGIFSFTIYHMPRIDDVKKAFTKIDGSMNKGEQIIRLNKIQAGVDNLSSQTNR